MKQYSFTRKLLYASLVFVFCSCGGNKEKSNDDVSSAESSLAINDTASAVPAAVSTITTTPQVMLIIRHKVANFAKWQPSYEAHDSMRLANGLHNYVIGRSLADSNMILVALKADDLEKARAFTKNPNLKEAMQKGGVMGIPNIMFTTSYYQDNAIVNSSIRSMNIMTVKDADAWQTAFNEGKQERLDNGIVERVIGRDADNDKKVVLVTALLDTAKANAYSVSDALKKRREASGVIGTPERFLFNIVKRY